MVYYGFYSATGKQATGTGPLKLIRGLAAAISHPGMGTGKRVCVAKHEGRGRNDTTVACYEGGRRVGPSRGTTAWKRRRR